MFRLLPSRLLHLQKVMKVLKVGSNYTVRPKTIALGVAFVSTCGYAYYFQWNSSIDFYFEPTYENQSIIDRLSIKSFRPSFFFPNAFLQLTYQAKIEKSISLDFDREIYEFNDGGQLALDWLNRKEIIQDGQPIIVITHGLTGGSDSNYIKNAAESLKNAGYTVVCYNQRGVACELKSKKYHLHGDTSDLREVLNYLFEKYPSAHFYGVSFSIGANLLLKYAGQESSKCRLKGIVSVANPYNLQECSLNILKTKNKIYNYFITTNFIQLLRKNEKQLREHEKEKGVNIDNALSAKNTYEFDENFTRRLFDYNSVEELYLDISCEEYIDKVTVPVLALHSKDDPIVPYHILPLAKLKRNPNIIVATTQRGGHIEWLSGIQPKRWVSAPIIDYLKVRIELEKEIALQNQTQKKLEKDEKEQQLISLFESSS